MHFNDRPVGLAAGSQRKSHWPVGPAAGSQRKSHWPVGPADASERVKKLNVSLW